MNQHEQRFSDLLDTVQRHVHTCVAHAYSELAVHQLAATNAEVFAALSRNLNFWNALLAAHQTAAFIALGRVYDNQRGAKTLGALIRLAEENPGIFSRKALAERWCDTRGLTEEQAASLSADCWEPGRSGFAELRKLHDLEKAEYEAKVAEIRHQIIAHPIAATRAEEKAKFANLKLREFERLVLTPYRMHEALRQVFQNGFAPELPVMPSDIGDVLAARRHFEDGIWGHVRTVDDVAEFIQSLLSHPAN